MDEAHPFASTQMSDLLERTRLPGPDALDSILKALGLGGVVRLVTPEGAVHLFDRGSFTIEDWSYQLAGLVLGGADLLLFRREGERAELVLDQEELRSVEANAAYASAAAEAWVDEEEAQHAFAAVEEIARDHTLLVGKDGVPRLARVETRVVVDGVKYAVVIPAEGDSSRGKLYRDTDSGLVPVRDPKVVARVSHVLAGGGR